ncbi:hypothetical protein Hanom_Chr04g00304591 [Helianthus anomalus]
MFFTAGLKAFSTSNSFFLGKNWFEISTFPIFFLKFSAFNCGKFFSFMIGTDFSTFLTTCGSSVFVETDSSPEFLTEPLTTHL